LLRRQAVPEIEFDDSALFGAKRLDSRALEGIDWGGVWITVGKSSLRRWRKRQPFYDGRAQSQEVDLVLVGKNSCFLRHKGI
jgi:hypothetical protein